MKQFTVSLLVGAAGLFVSGVQAAPLTNGTPFVDNDVQNVRTVCDHHGNCREEHHEQSTVIIQQDRSHQPPPEHHNDRPQPQQHGQPGIGVHVPGVSIGIGGGPDRSHDDRR